MNWFSAPRREVAEYDKNPYYKFFDKINTINRFPQTTSPTFVGWGTFNLFSGQWIHIASGFHEIGRGRYYLNASPSSYSLSSFTDYNFGGVKFEVPPKTRDAFLLDLIKSYFDKLNLQEVANLGYNPWDFVYWEDHSAGWLAAPAYYNFLPFAEVVVLVNCRRVFEIMWQVPDEYINDSYLLYTCIMNEHDTRYRQESFMDKSHRREVTMGKNFKPSPKDYDNYALVYGGYLLKGDPIEIAKKALAVNPTIEWAIRAIQNSNPDKK